jgi:hypothetical protein
LDYTQKAYLSTCATLKHTWLHIYWKGYAANLLVPLDLKGRMKQERGRKPTGRFVLYIL